MLKIPLYFTPSGRKIQEQEKNLTVFLGIVRKNHAKLLKLFAKYSCIGRLPMLSYV